MTALVERQSARDGRNIHIRNPLAEAVVHWVDGEAESIDVSAFSSVRGFTKMQLRRGKSAGFDAALRLLEREGDGDPVSAGLSAAEAASLWQAGLIIVPEERGVAFVPEDFAVAGDAFDRHGFILLPACLTPMAVAALQAHYARLIDWGTIRRGDDQTDYFIAHDDAAARIVSHTLREPIERLIGRPIKAGFGEAALYVGGTAIPKCTDRRSAEYTLMLQVDYRLLRRGECSPWLLSLFPERDMPVEFMLAVGGGLLFRDRDITHARPPLPAEDLCWMLHLNYVSADFRGSWIEPTSCD